MLSARGPARTPTPTCGTMRSLTPRDSGLRAATAPGGSRTATPRGAEALKAAAGVSLGADAKNASLGKTVVPHPAKLAGFRLGTVVAPDVAAAGNVYGPANEFNRGRRNEVILETPRTPELDETRRRHRKRTEPGETYTNWAMKEMAISDAISGMRKKKPGTEGDSVAQTFSAGHKTGIALYLNQVGERVYKSTKEEPLGQPFTRGHVLPEYLNDPEWVGFGRASEGNDNTAKDAIFPRGIKKDTKEIHEMYKKTHGNYFPGEAHVRHYNWPKMVADDPLFRFGRSDKTDMRGAGLGAKRLLHADRPAPGMLKRTDIVDIRSENYQQVNEDPLSMARNLKQDSARKDPDHVHGIKSDTDSTNAAALINGAYSENEQKPDEDLGRCTIRGRRNFVTAVPMGVPSVRLDKPAPVHFKRSVANCTNYGDDVDASGLIAPNKHFMMGVSDTDFQNRRSQDELKVLFNTAGAGLEDSSFDVLFASAARLYGDDQKLVSLELMTAMYDDFIAARGRMS